MLQRGGITVKLTVCQELLTCRRWQKACKKSTRRCKHQCIYSLVLSCRIQYFGNRQVQRTNGRCFGIGFDIIGYAAPRSKKPIRSASPDAKALQQQCINSFFIVESNTSATARSRGPTGGASVLDSTLWRGGHCHGQRHWSRRIGAKASNGEQVVILNLGNRQVQRTNGRCFGIGFDIIGYAAPRSKKPIRSASPDAKALRQQCIYSFFYCRIRYFGNRQVQRTNGRCFGIGFDNMEGMGLATDNGIGAGALAQKKATVSKSSSST
jgi:hypothetical protein